MPTGIPVFLSGGEAVKQHTAPTSTKMGPVDAPWPDHEEGPQQSSTPARGARPKVQSSTSQPQLRPEGLDLVSHPCRWINAKMLKIPNLYWWKTLMPCGRIMFACILCENLSESEALHIAQWQVAAFWLPLAQNKTVGWWGPPPAIPGLQFDQYMPSPASSKFRVMREQRTLALERVLHANTEESGCPMGVLCKVVRELQMCMAHLLALNGDEIVEASFLQPMEGEHGTSPMPEEEAALMGDIKPDIQSDIKPDIKAPHVPVLLEIQEQTQPAEWTVTPTTSPTSPYPKGKEAQERDNCSRCYRCHPVDLFPPQKQLQSA